MAIDGVPWTFTALLALSLPPALLLLLARRSKRSENNISSSRRSMRTARIMTHMSTPAIPRMQATSRSSGGRETLVASLFPRAHTRLGSAAAKVFMFACTAAVMIPDDVGAFVQGAGCILTVRKLPALTLSHTNSNSRSRWERVLKHGGARRRWVVGW